VCLTALVPDAEKDNVTERTQKHSRQPPETPVFSYERPTPDDEYGNKTQQVGRNGDVEGIRVAVVKKRRRLAGDKEQEIPEDDKYRDGDNLRYYPCQVQMTLEPVEFFYGSIGGGGTGKRHVRGRRLLGLIKRVLAKIAVLCIFLIFITAGRALHHISPSDKKSQGVLTYVY
jgi:hypothetical protein